MLYVFTHVPARTHAYTCIYSIHQILIVWFWMVCGSTWFRLIVTATTNIGRSGRRSFDQNTGATAVIYSMHTVQFMIISKQYMTYIVVFSMHQMPGVKDLTELMTMYFISKSIVNENVLPQMEMLLLFEPNSFTWWNSIGHADNDVSFKRPPSCTKTWQQVLWLKRPMSPFHWAT